MEDRYTFGNVQRRADMVQISDRLDLQNDPIADNGEHPEFAFEFETVAAIERETSDCIRIDFESGFSCGFPTDHWIDVDGEQFRLRA